MHCLILLLIFALSLHNRGLFIITFSTVLDAGIRVPKGLLDGNFYHFGNYHQCLNINEVLPDSTIQGKHCSVSFPASQNLTLPEFTLPEWPDIPWPELFPQYEEYLDGTLKSFSNTKQFSMNFR